MLDPVGGLADLAARRLRFVGDARARITEDYLRILRFSASSLGMGARPTAQLLPPATNSGAACWHLEKERIGHEMRKLLAAPDPAQAVALMAEAGVLPLVLPGADGSDPPT